MNHSTGKQKERISMFISNPHSQMLNNERFNTQNSMKLDHMQWAEVAIKPEIQIVSERKQRLFEERKKKKDIKKKAEKIDLENHFFLQDCVPKKSYCLSMIINR